MGFTDEQTKLLQAKLEPQNVKRRKDGGKYHYVEAWHAIDEANRIFGFDAWKRETIDMHCVCERDTVIGKGQKWEKPGFSVSYISKVRITIDGIVREGTGAGHGIDADVGQAHEGAVKEAESDAMKRALVTFGYPFGLALYDKEQKNVGFNDDPEAYSQSWGEKRANDLLAGMAEPIRRKVALAQQEIDAADSEDALKIWKEQAREVVETLPDGPREGLQQYYANRVHILRSQLDRMAAE